jgi:argininosuccinate synthase
MGLVNDPLYSDLSAFVDQSQKRVNGVVRMKLSCGRAFSVGRRSPDAIYDQEMVSFDSKTLSRGTLRALPSTTDPGEVPGER